MKPRVEVETQTQWRHSCILTNPKPIWLGGGASFPLLPVSKWPLEFDPHFPARVCTTTLRRQDRTVEQLTARGSEWSGEVKGLTTGHTAI